MAREENEVDISWSVDPSITRTSTSQAGTNEQKQMVPDIVGIHHVKIPVTDLAYSRAWYERVLDLEPHIEWCDDDGVTRGVAYRPKRGFTLALRENPAAATGLTGFDPLAILVDTRADLDAWVARLDRLAVAHGPVLDGTLGWLVTFPDPDGIELKLYTEEPHGLDPATRSGRGRFVPNSAGTTVKSLPATPRSST
jgi:catechol-2,3-dioxygenase